MDIGKTKKITNVPEPIVAPDIRIIIWPEPEKEKVLVPVRRKEKDHGRR